MHLQRERCVAKVLYTYIVLYMYALSEQLCVSVSQDKHNVHPVYCRHLTDLHLYAPSHAC